jgi:hypothetical protein
VIDIVSEDSVADELVSDPEDGFVADVVEARVEAGAWHMSKGFAQSFARKLTLTSPPKTCRKFEQNP